MLEFIENQKNTWYGWARERAQGKAFKTWLAIIAFSESIILPIPTAVFLLALYGAGAKKWYYYAFFTTLFSILGGMVGYFVGLFFFDAVGAKIVDFYDLGHELEKVKGLYNDNAFWVTFTGAFTPIPYKIFVLTAGFLKVNFVQFIIASIIGRGLQFFLIAFVMKHFGDTATKLVLKYFNYLALFIVAVIAYLLIF
jgi:membrane protein YqaA with SNARE-associated domain